MLQLNLRPNEKKPRSVNTNLLLLMSLLLNTSSLVDCVPRKQLNEKLLMVWRHSIKLKKELLIHWENIGLASNNDY